MSGATIIERSSQIEKDPINLGTLMTIVNIIFMNDWESKLHLNYIWLRSWGGDEETLRELG